MVRWRKSVKRLDSKATSPRFSSSSEKTRNFICRIPTRAREIFGEGGADCGRDEKAARRIIPYQTEGGHCGESGGEIPRELGWRGVLSATGPGWIPPWDVLREPAQHACMINRFTSSKRWRITKEFRAITCRSRLRRS